MPNNIHVDDSPGFHTLTIFAVQSNNAGTYTCKGNKGKLGDPGSSLFEDEGILIVKGI